MFSLYLSVIVFSGSIAGEGQKSTRLQGWEDEGGLSPPFQHPHARLLLCHSYPSCKAEITPLAHAGKHWQGWKHAGPGGKMSPKGTVLPAVIDGALIGGVTCPGEGHGEIWVLTGGRSAPTAAEAGTRRAQGKF